MNLSKLNPDVELRDILSGNIKVQTASGTMVAIPVYGDEEQPTAGLADDFIVVRSNGSPLSVTDKMGVWRGNLMVHLFCKMNPDGSAKKNRISKILEQLETYLKRASGENFFYSINILRPITPTTVNQSSGYSSTVLNAEWHTKNN